MKGIDIRQMRQGTVRSAQTETKKNSFSLWDFLQKDISFGARFGNGQKEAFYHELGTLLAAGLDLKASLDLLLAQRSKAGEVSIIRHLKDGLVSGQSLAQALQDQSVFSAYEFHSVQIGEETGRLAEILTGLGDYYRQQLKQRRQLIGALTYPAMIMLVSIGAVTFMLRFVVPMFTDMFRHNGNDLPFATQLIVRASDGMKHYMPLLFIGLSAIGTVLYTQRKKNWYRRLHAELLLRLPFFGAMARKVYLARFCQSMSLLTASRVPLIRAMELCRHMVGFYPIQVSLKSVETDVLHGKALHESLGRHTIYDTKLIALVKVGEEVNQLDTFFSKLSQQYQEDVEHRSAILASLLEPFLMIFLGIVVGFILIAMYLPLFQMGVGLE